MLISTQNSGTIKVYQNLGENLDKTAFYFLVL